MSSSFTASTTLASAGASGFDFTASRTRSDSSSRAAELTSGKSKHPKTAMFNASVASSQLSGSVSARETTKSQSKATSVIASAVQNSLTIPPKTLVPSHTAMSHTSLHASQAHLPVRYPDKLSTPLAAETDDDFNPDSDRVVLNKGRPSSASSRISLNMQHRRDESHNFTLPTHYEDTEDEGRPGTPVYKQFLVISSLRVSRTSERDARRDDAKPHSDRPSTPALPQNAHRKIRQPLSFLDPAHTLIPTSETGATVVMDSVIKSRHVSRLVVTDVHKAISSSSPGFRLQAVPSDVTEKTAKRRNGVANASDLMAIVQTFRDPTTLEKEIR